MESAYGGYNLKLKDSDFKCFYEGRNLSAPTDNIPQPGQTGYVRQLQEDLEKLGFKLSPTYGEFDLKTEWAVREFQIYAKMPFVAKLKANAPATKRYVDTLEPTQNTNQYKDYISGVVNQRTRQLIQFWLANNWRCPVVVEIWYKNFNKKIVNQPDGTPQNIWLTEQFNDKKARIFVRDFSGYYIPADTIRDDYRRYDDFLPNRPRDERDKLIVLGIALKGGPLSDVPNNVWYPETEILPDNLVGKALNQLTAEELSTYKVIRTAAEQECIGYFDCINAWDDAVISLGPCHWTLLLGELGAFLAYLKYQDESAFKKAIGFFGIQIDKDWFEGAGAANGESLFNSGMRAYAAWPSQNTEAGDYETIAKYNKQAGFKREETKKYANYFKTWHWFYRFVMASRTIEGFRRCMWDMARIRLRDILSTPWSKETDPNGGAGDRRTKIGDVYTSEKAVALLLRYHIWRPASIVLNGKVSNLAASKSNPPPLQQAYQRAVERAGNNPPSQPDLVNAIIEVVTNWVGNKPADLDSKEGKEWQTRNGFLETLKQVRDWPTWQPNNNRRRYQLRIDTGLSIEPNSLKLFSSGLAGIPLPDKSKLYGGYKLRQGDFDKDKSNPPKKFKYGGSFRSASQEEPLPDSEEKGFVRELQEDLQNLGFLLKKPDGIFDKKTAEAVREFQRYAQMEYVAQLLQPPPPDTQYYVERLQPFKNFQFYKGAVSGVANEATRGLIKEWLRRDLRCPVVIYGRNLTPPNRLNLRENVQPEPDNIWLYSDVQTEGTQIFVKDFTQHYADGLPPSHQDGLFALGHYYAPGEFLFSARLELQADLDNSPNLSDAWRQEFAQATPPIMVSNTVTVESDRANHTWIIKDIQNHKEYTIRRTETALNVFTRLPGGPRILGFSQNASNPYHNCWQEAEILPVNLIGKAPSELNNAERSTFLVLRAVVEAASQNESFGFLDSVRAYDRNIPAFGLFDVQENSDGQELFAHLAYLRSINPAAFKKAFEFFGIRADKDWEDNKGEANGVALYNKEQRNYTALPALETLASDDETVTETDEDISEDFATWHWFYRFVMANRTIAGHRQAIWDMTRVRWRDLLATPFPKGFLPDIGTRRALLGDVFTSEQAIAIVFYWYLRFPQEIVDKGIVGEKLRHVCTRAVTNNSSPTSWTNSEEESLIRELITEGIQRHGSEFGQVLENLCRWPLWVEGSNPHGYQLCPADVFAQPQNRKLELAPGRHSFQFDATRMTPPIPKSVTAIKRAIRLSSPPVSGERLKFSVLALAEEDEDAPGNEIIPETLKITAVILTIKTENEIGIKLPIKRAPIDFKFKLNQNPNGKTKVWDTSNSEQQYFDIYDISDDAELPPETSWELDISAMQDGVANLLQVEAKLNWNSQRQVYLQTEIKAPFFRSSLKWVFAAAGTPQSDRADFFNFSIEERQLKFELASVLKVFQNVLPITFTNAIKANLTLELVEQALSWRLETEAADKIAIDLGSSLVRLELGLPKLTLDAFEGLSVSFPQAGAKVALYLDLFSWAEEDQKIINNLFSNDAVVGSTDVGFEPFNWLLKLTSASGALDNLPTVSDLFIWKTGIYPTIHKDLLAALTETTVNVKRKLQAFAGDVLGAILPTQVTFKPAQKPIELVQEEDYWRLLVSLILQVNGVKDSTLQPIFQATGKFGFSASVSEQDPENYLDIQAGAFRADDKIEIQVLEDNVSSFANLVSLYIPQGSIFDFYTDPRSPKIKWVTDKSQQKTPNKIALRIPGSKTQDIGKSEAGCFTFEMEKFSLGTDGFDLKGAVRVESVWLGEPKITGFQKPLAIKGIETKREESQESKIGEIEFRQSKLVYGSLQAVAQLSYFDDAIATFSLAISQDKTSASLAVAGTLDITGLSEFHVDALFATFQITLLHLETKYQNGDWNSSGAMSGRVKFEPAKGKSAAEMGELAELFKGVTVEFESLNPVEMGVEDLTVQFPSKQFEFAKIFKIDLRGIKILKEKGFELLGDIAIERLPGVDAQLSFGGITLIPRANQAPEFTVRRIGAGFSVAGGFEMHGQMDWIDDEKETGFGGAVTIKTEALPQLTGLLKLTQAKTLSGEVVAAIAVYFETELEVALFAGFFLRGLGLGLGINQALNGLQNKDLPLPQRIIAFVDNPRGLPEPKLLPSWVANPPANASQPINWMLVGKGVISYGKLPPDKEHPLVGSILLAIDQDLDIVAAVNLWLFCSPQQTGQEQFIRNPAGRGALAISPRAEQVYGLFRTIKDPKLSDNAPKLLADVLKQVSTTLMFLGDRNGFLLEVGWPWETKITYQYGSILKGTLSSGYRFGIYRGLISFGLNFAINVVLNAQAKIEFSTRFGKAGASLSVYGEGYFRCSFVGALTPSFRPYLLGEVRVAATVEVRAAAYCEFSKKILGIRIRLKISFRTSLKVSISAILVAAMEGADIGFKGDAKVAISVAGYWLSGNVPFRYQDDKVAVVEQQLHQMLPRPIAAKSAFRVPMAAFALRETELKAVAPQIWNYRFCRVQNQIRVLLFPKPGLPEPGREYPRVLKLFDVVDDGSIETGLNGNQIAPLLRNQFADSDKLSDHVSVAKVRNHWRIYDSARQNYYSIWLDAKRYHVYKISNAPRFQVNLQQTTAFRGFLGSGLASDRDSTNSLLEWEENLNRVVMIRDEVLANRAPSVVSDNSAEVRNLTVGDLLFALTEPSQTQTAFSNFQAENVTETVDPRTQNPVAANADDETAGIAPEGQYSPYFKPDDREDSYDRKLAAACEPDAPLSNEVGDSEGLSPGLLIGELVSLVKDTQANPQQNAASYTLAPHLNLVLVFEDNKALLPDEDPVPKLLDLVSFKVDGQETKLESPVGDKKPKYDLIAGTHFQRKSQICLTWNFKREDENTESIENREIQEIGKVYEELDRFVVTRTVLQKPNETRIFPDLHPSVLVAESEVLRPQFQFVDDLVQDGEGSIEDGDLVQYKVVAQTLDDRLLASCIINVVRRTIKPLQPPSQSLALHQLQFANNNNYTQGNFEVAVAFSDLAGEEPRQIITQLQLLYRLIPASTVGLYGFEQSPEMKTKWLTKKVGQDEENSIAISYAESESDRTLTWEELQRLNLSQLNPDRGWETLSISTQHEQNNQAVQLGYHLLFSEEKLWQQVGEIPPGMAIEFYIGREQKQGERIEQRSQLFRCRHAIQLPFAAQTNQSDDVKIHYFSRGNPVNAIEKLPPHLPVITYLAPHFVQGQVSYTETAAQLLLTWRHDRSGRGDTNFSFNPVANYRIHRSDEYSPLDYVRYADEAKILARPELTIRVVPEIMYKSTPSTIEVQGRVSQGQIVTDWNVKEIEPDLLWKKPESRSQIHAEPLQRKSTESGPVWLLTAIVEVLDKIKQILAQKQLDIRYILKFHYPLEDRSSPAVSQEGGTVKERLEKLVKTLDEKTDPFGWWALEALGLSCECHFEDREGRPLDSHYLTKILRQELKDTISDYPISFALFLAEDGKTFLNVLRVFYAEPLKFDEETNGTLPYLYLKAPLGVRLQGREDEKSDQPLDLKQLDFTSKELLETWLRNIQYRLNRQFVPGSVVIYQYNAADAERTERSRPAQITLPINAEGLIECDLPIPDLWAHQYAIALRIIRRYDTLWSRLQPPQLSTNVQKIPYSHLKHIPVERSLPLVPHNIIATPLPGGIQSLVFAHPAAFAAAASAVNAVSGQYSGQTVLLQRRINPDERNKIANLYNAAEIQWQLYQNWLNTAGFEQIKPGPFVLKNERGEWNTLALKPIEGTQAGIYGADRYVFPDLPAYYEYRVAAYSTAGRVCSEVKTTSFTAPLYDKIRQRPRTVACRDAIFNPEDSTLKLTLRLIHPRFHLRDEISPLWVNAEEMFEVRKGEFIRYGSWPDAYLNYQLYIQENPDESFSDPVLLPLAEIVPPLIKGMTPERLSWKAKAQLIGATFDGNSELNLSVLQAGDNANASRLELGELYLEFKLHLNDSQCEKVLHLLRQYSNQPEKIRSLIYLSVARDGVWSPIVQTP
jgi:peptidoglycan hydrolase-like protein with peptidoglycan-binding domain